MSDFEPITTQADLDRIISARLAREAVKAQEALDALKLEHSTELDTLKAAHDAALATAKTDAEAAATAAKAEAETAKGEAAAAQLVALRLTTAADKGVPAELLSGSTAEELQASADKLLDFQKSGTTYGPAQGLDDLTEGGDRDQEARRIFGL